MESAASDDLEITSIGALYRGQWLKKYWSSSRIWRSLCYQNFMLYHLQIGAERIPNSNSIIGHNGLGDFGICFRNISKRVLLDRFSSPGSTTFQILPVGLFNCRAMGNLATVSGMEEHIKVIIPMTDNCCPKTEVQHQREKPNMSPIGWWRLALFVKNEVIMGSILDHRICAVTASADYGIYGTCDGFLYQGELPTGEKVANVHPFKCGNISSIAL